MKLVPSDPDLESLVRRIRAEELNLQPDFQRGEIWSVVKKQKLIDSVLRDWYIPPIHIIVDEVRRTEEVLDGQQRLAAIRDFASDGLTVDGRIEPFDDRIFQLHGLTYSELPEDFKRVFDRFSIRLFRIFDYQPDEPYELFFRLNQSVMLTAAEQRNTFFGEAREQVRLLVTKLEQNEITSSQIGFSNSRMAYDDILARLCLVLEHGSADIKVGSNLLTDRYRSPIGFPASVISLAEHTVDCFSRTIHQLNQQVRFNKATFFSWLYFVAQLLTSNGRLDERHLVHFVLRFEELRKIAKDKFGESLHFMRTSPHLEFELKFIHEFNDRATARVWDTSSVQIRDAVLWLILYYERTHIAFETPRNLKLSFIRRNLIDSRNLPPKELLNKAITSAPWTRR